MNNNETNLTMPERIRNIVCDARFMEFCAREADKNQFVKYFDTYLKLARINTANERVNKDMFNIYLSPPQVEAATIEFYEWLDSVCPSKPLTPQVKENMKYESRCYQNEDIFNYHGIKNALCGKTGNYGYEYFTPKRILVIQMTN